MPLQDSQDLNDPDSIFLERDTTPYAVDTLEEIKPPDVNAVNLSLYKYGKGLSVQASANDVREVVRFLRNKTSGLSFGEISNSEPRRIFEPHKIDAYEYWGVIGQIGDRIKLTTLGEKLADIITFENKIFEEIIFSIPIYVEILKWIIQHNIKLLTYSDINVFFSQLQNKERFAQISEVEVVSFFSLCHAAELGVATAGRKGHPSRLRIEAERIEALFLPGKRDRNSSNLKHNLQHFLVPSEIKSHDNYQKSSTIQQVYISATSASGLIENLYYALELADLESVILDQPEKDDYFQSGRLQQMQLCQAGIIIMSDEDCYLNQSERTEINLERLTEITVAAGLFSWRIVIVWDSLFPPPENLERFNLPLLHHASENSKTSYQAVKLLKNMNSTVSNQTAE